VRGLTRNPARGREERASSFVALKL